MELRWGSATVEDRLSRDIPHLSFNVSTYTPNRKFAGTGNGIQIVITVWAVQGNIPMCEIKPSEEIPYPPEHATAYSQRLREWGKNLMFDPVPLEMLFTPAFKP
jgi:hypothetical protein